jgi:hypothetical protein
MAFDVFDFGGNKTTYDWLVSYFGNVVVKDIDSEKYAVSELLARKDDATVVVKVLDKNGVPKSGVKVAFYWPDAPIDGSAGWYGRCVAGLTKEDGCIGFGMGGGAYYKPEDGIGPHAVWVYGSGASQMVDGIGMVWGTNHDHVNITFREVDSTAPTYKKLVVSTVGNGEVVKSPESSTGEYVKGTSVSVMAVPDSGWEFDHWGGDLAGTSVNPAIVVLDMDRTISATFVESVTPPVPCEGLDEIIADLDKEILGLESIKIRLEEISGG